ncbi:hypothetical protein CAPTEDRAFT_157335 [Capitella teleta]|uniref:SHSP domain-containing protein n=1 Tax=Capitella teleta TaxID=283909 RepID=R7UNG9_CAPTE|nr:hypothetical protein CAPTEDRAFT_157335 [Capitella teleta]|eukprot:ELU05487.1 hypothetical protein CAPTEDRAFT_157335 [Capitella teleta]
MAYELFPQLLQPNRYRMSPMRLAYDPFSDLFSELGGTCQWMPLSTGDKKQATKPKAPAALNWQEIVPGYAQCECQKKPQQPGTAEKSSADATEEKKEVEKGEGEKKSEEKQASGETSSEVAVTGDQILAFEVKPFKITVDISGYAKDDVKVDHHGNRIAVCGEHQEDGAEYSFAKAFTLPDFVDVDKLKWNIDEKNSALVITAPML